MQADTSGTPEFENELRRVLYRYDCPDAHTLGEYELDKLDAVHRTIVAAHAAECDECQVELQVRRAFLRAAEPAPMPQSLVERARRVVATLFTPAPGLAYGRLRGAADSATRVFEADDVTITVGPGQGAGTLMGLVLASATLADGESLGAARLIAIDGSAFSSALDNLGNFEFAHVAPGQYALEIDLADTVVVVQEIRVA
jgi:hypothetical protein